MTGCHDTGADSRRTVAVVGAPNVGKSALFNALSDREVEVSNYPGTTVASTVGAFEHGFLVDAPGVHGISSFSEEERVTRGVVLDADVVVNVVDATQLDRDLFLTHQLLDMGLPTVVALNMVDELDGPAAERCPRCGTLLTCSALDCGSCGACSGSLSSLAPRLFEERDASETRDT